MRPLFFVHPENVGFWKGGPGSGWFGPDKGGTHGKIRGKYEDADLLPVSELQEFYDAEIAGRPVGDIVKNPEFIIGKLSAENTALAAKFFQKPDVPSELRITGRVIKHVDERRSDVLREIIGDLDGHFVDDVTVFPNHKEAGKILLVSAKGKTASGKNYVCAVEFELGKDAMYASSVMTMPDRTLRQAQEVASNWQEGQQPPFGDYPHPVAPEGAHAEADFSDVQPSGSTTKIAEPMKKSSVILIFRSLHP